MASGALADRVIGRDPRAIARAITLVENEDPRAAALVARVYPRTGRAYLVGVTGPPGAGKSTLVDRLTSEFRRRGATVGVLAIDPTSPFTGGAILGDRVRMSGHAEDAGVFIRSLATRGHLGGLARTTAEAAIVLDAAGFDVVIIETVGVGQGEIDIVRTADVSIVTVVPGAGDEVQTLKAGIMEIADVFVVNKADHDGADRAAAAIESMLGLAPWPEGAWRPPVLRTTATTGAGVAELVQTIDRFREASGPSLGARRRARVEWRLREMLGRAFLQHVETRVFAAGEFDALLDQVAAREVDPYGAVDRVMDRALGGGAPGGGAVHLPVDHVGIATRDAVGLVFAFARVFDLTADEPQRVGKHRIRFVQTGGATLELVEPAEDDAPIAKFLATRGPGLHHVCLRVPDIDAALADLKARGIRLVDEVPRRGANGARIAFIHPSSTGGILIELKQRAED